MRRETIDFETFRTNFIEQPDGFFPVCSEFEETDDGELIRVLKLDMICEWRLPDGKIRFIEVPFETEEQFNAIVAYLKVAAGLLNKAILEGIDDLSYADTIEDEEDDEGQ